jgi:hypothetical protein
MMKLTIAMLVCMAALIGPSVALNPQYEIPLSTCEGEGFADGLLFDQYTYDAGYRVWEGFVEVNGVPFYLSETGMIQYLGVPLDVYAERTIQYFIYRINEFGEPIDGTYEGHTVGVNLNPCVVEPPVCECEPNDPGDNIRITPPTTIGQTVRSQWFPPGGNGNWQVRMYIDGVKTSKWNGEYPIEVIAKELDENWVPTGFEISDCICG